MYDPNNIFNSDHYDHWLAHYWEYRTARVQFENFVPNGQSLIRATYITEAWSPGIQGVVLRFNDNRPVPLEPCGNLFK
jgi:hypothetical protein